MDAAHSLSFIFRYDSKEPFVVYLKKTISTRSVMGVLSTAKSTHITESVGGSGDKGTLKEESDSSVNLSLGLDDPSEADIVTKFDLSNLLSNFGKKKFSANDVVQAFDSEVGCVSYVVKGTLASCSSHSSILPTIFF